MIAAFVKQKRQGVNLNQTELAEKAGVGLRFVRDLEQGKETLRLDKVNQVLKLFGYELGPVAFDRNKEFGSTKSDSTRTNRTIHSKKKSKP
jgi:y4mF family transcriptional regulator